jgi:hypothetical protein
LLAGASTATWYSDVAVPGDFLDPVVVQEPMKPAWKSQDCFVEYLNRMVDYVPERIESAT